MHVLTTLTICVSLCAGLSSAVEITATGSTVPAVHQAGANSANPETYLLGPNDSLYIHVLHIDELGTQPYVVDLKGDIDLPRIGRMHVAGITLAAFEGALVRAYSEYLRHPVVTVTITEYKSQPVSVLGQVGAPGVYQIRGRASLLEVLSEAGGLKPEAGNRINLARMKSLGPIPVANGTFDSQHDLYVARLDIHALMDGRSNDQNIMLMPHDIVTVPKADLVYVFGAVRRPGGFALSEKESLSVLQALTLAEGLDATAGAKHAKILRSQTGLPSRTEIPVNVKTLIEGKSSDVPLLANDILVIPKSAAKAASLRTLEAVVQAGTGFAIYHPF